MASHTMEAEVSSVANTSAGTTSVPRKYVNLLTATESPPFPVEETNSSFEDSDPMLATNAEGFTIEAPAHMQ
jgi:hypothetical protein